MKKLLLVLVLGATVFGQKFYPDDPLLIEPPPLDAGRPARRKLSDWYDLFWHVLATPGEKQPRTGPPIRAKNVNTLGDPMDGAWYVRRHYWRRMTIEELQRGAGGTAPPVFPWTVVAAKGEGITPGFTVIDATKRRFFIKLDPKTNPEMMTAAEVISARFFYALGYHVADEYIVEFDPQDLVIEDRLTFINQHGIQRPFTPRNLTELLLKAPRTRSGRYRAVASLALEGQPLGPFRWFGTRADDPNDTVPHEHRRELRAAHVFFAWLNHDDSRAINTLDTLISRGGKSFIRHHLLDFGSTLGSGSDRPNSPRSGAYLFDWRESLMEMATLGLHVPYWAKAKYPKYPSIGLFESKVFDPEKWLPEYPNPALLNRLPDDEFWGAKQVMHFTDEEIRAIVRTGELSDPEAEEYLVRCLIERRDKIGRAYFRKVLPIDRFEVRGGELVFEDLAARHGLPSPAAYEILWREFDNETGQAGRVLAAGPRVPSGAGPYCMAEISSASRPGQKVFVWLRGAQVVGIERTW
ncbi:MAG: hypothetical protein ACP5UT_17120 [Bryobacteraceae bacterium]